MRNHKLENLIFEEFEPLKDLLNRFLVDFPDFPNHRIKEIQLIIKLFTKISVESRDDYINLEEDIVTDSFCLQEFEEEITSEGFVYHDLTDLGNSIVLLDLNNLDGVDTLINDDSLTMELIFPLLSKIGNTSQTLNLSKYVLINNNLNGQKNRIFAYVALHLVRAGKLVHSPYNYNLLPQVNPRRKIVASNEYQQFSDSIAIISEYNYQKDILDKYLRIYHVVENFMFKSPLVALERKHNGRAFSIRDFQRMYFRISKSEISVLKKLFDDVLKLDYSGSVKFQKFILDKLQALVNSAAISTDHLDKLLALLKIEKGEEFMVYRDINLNTISGAFAQLVYAFRNALVHNRETEFHLTHLTLTAHPEINDSPKKILELFLIPVLEEIVFYLIIERNNIVWYNNPTISLYNVN